MEDSAWAPSSSWASVSMVPKGRTFSFSVSCFLHRSLRCRILSAKFNLLVKSSMALPELMHRALSLPAWDDLNRSNEAFRLW